MEPIQHSSPWIVDSDLEAVSSVLSSGMLGQGEILRTLEKRLAGWVGLHDGVGVASGSAGIMLALKGLLVGVGDEVILPTYVCKSVLEAVVSVNATPVFCDVGPDWVVTPETAARVISKRTKAIIVPHMYGIFADIEKFQRLGIPLIEDCAQALDEAGRRIAYGNVVVFSFHPTKCITSGEGGMAAASSVEVLQRMRNFRDGTKDEVSKRFFAPLSDLSAALAISQLDRYGKAITRRREIAIGYLNVVEECSPGMINRAAFERSMFFRLPLRISSRFEILQQAFLEYGIHVRRGVDVLLHRLLGWDDQYFPQSVRHYNSTLSLPIYPALSDEQEHRCAEAIEKILSKTS